MSKLLLGACLAVATLLAFAQPSAAAPGAASRAPAPVVANDADAGVAAAARAAGTAAAANAADAAMQANAATLAAQLDGLLAPSRSPRDQALRWDLARWQAPGGQGLSTPRASLRDAAAAAPSDRLVQWLWARATPAQSGCIGPRDCPGRAQALATLEPGNGAAWLPVLEQAWDAEDDVALEAALSHMARAHAYDDLFAGYAGAWAEIENRFPAYVSARSAVLAGTPWAGSSDVASIVSAIARSASSAIPDMGTLVNVCDRGKHPEAAPARFARCGQVGRLMLGKGTSILSRSIGYVLIKRSGLPTDQDRQANASFRWRMQQSADLHLDEKDPIAFRRYFADLVQTNDELAAMDRQLARAGKPTVPPAGWKAPGED